MAQSPETQARPLRSTSAELPTAGATAPKRPLWLRLARDIGGLLLIAGVIYAGTRWNGRPVNEESPEAERDRLGKEVSAIRNELAENHPQVAAERARRLVYAHPEYGTLWILLGDSLLAAEEFQDAVNAYESADTFPRFREYAQFGLARAFCKLDEHEIALDHLELASSLGLKRSQSVADDPSFESLVGNRRFERISREIDLRTIINPRDARSNPK